MKNLLIILFAILLVSCDNAEPLPSNIKMDSSHYYAFDWETNDSSQTATYTIFQQGIPYSTELKGNHFEVYIPSNAVFRFNVRDYSLRPYWKLSISLRESLDLNSGVYSPNEFKVVYSESGSTNVLNFGATTNKDGSLKIN